MGHRHQMGFRKAVEFILHQVEEFQQHVAFPGQVAEEILDIVKGLAFCPQSLGMRGHAITLWGVLFHASALTIGLCHNLVNPVGAINRRCKTVRWGKQLFMGPGHHV